MRLGAAGNAIGPGQWAAELVRDNAWGLRLRAGQELTRFKLLSGQWRQIAANYYGDFYPLAPWSREDTVWMTWQFDRTEAGQGMVQVFGRHNSFYESARLRLFGLDEPADCLVSDLDTGEREHRSGRELPADGLPVTIAAKPGFALLTYQRQK